MLNRTITYNDGDPKSWGLTFPIDSVWSSQKRRVLFFLQSVDGRDIKAGKVLGDGAVRTAFIESMRYGRSVARQYEPKLEDYGIAVANFQSRKHLHLKGHARAEAESEFRTRALKIIKKLNPTDIFFSGDLALLYPEIEHAKLKNGWVHKVDGRNVTSSLDFARLLEKNGAYANLLGFWGRHLANLLIKRHPHSIKDLLPTAFYVNTIKKFDMVMKEFDRSKRIAVDTETKNLSVNKNQIYTIQFAFDHTPKTGYVIPIDHPHEDNPFSQEERKYIKSELRKRFGQYSPDQELITFNGIYDLRVLRKCLKLDIIYMAVWECMAGEHLLDENISSMSSLGIKSGGLAAVLAAHENDFYLRGGTGFSKEDRNTIGSISPKDPGFLDYGAMDVVSLHGIRAMQIERAKLQMIAGKDYTPFFMAHMMHQMSDTVHQLSHLKESGSLVNKKYLRKLMQPDSVLSLAIKELQAEFKTFPEVREANKRLLGESGFKAKSLFSFGKSAEKEKDGKGQWTFSFGKTAHKLKLFLEILGLEAVNQTKTGAPSIDKAFVEMYQDRNYLVAKFGEYQKATKLLGTYVKGWYRSLTRKVDGVFDDHLRADYFFFTIDTGRLGSARPNLQNIPARGKLSKIIKEMFVALDGHLQIRFDYSAHEVRIWSIVAGDLALADTFRVGQKLRQQWIKAHPSDVSLTEALLTKDDVASKYPLKEDARKKYEAEIKSSSKKVARAAKRCLETDDIAKRLKKEGDLHILNVFKFFGKWIEKSDPLRDAIKKVVFGLLYGKGVETLAHDTKEADFNALRAKMGEAYKAKDEKTLAKLERDYKKLEALDRKDYVQDIINKLYGEFKKGKQWLDRMAKLAEEKQAVYSPIGRIRHLYASLTKDKSIVSRQVRRGMNAPIQGFASEIAVKASRVCMLSYYRNLAKLKDMLGLEKGAKFPIRFNRIVHDASYFTVPYEMVLPFVHILQYDMTYGVTKAYKKEFGFEFAIEPEIEMEFGVKDTESRKWGWALPELLHLLEMAVDDGLRDHFLTGDKRDIMDRILAPWRNDEVVSFLNEKWPLLGVDLEANIKEVMSAYEPALLKRLDEAELKAKVEAKAAIKAAKKQKVEA